MNEKPNIVVISTNSTRPDALIEQITKSPNIAPLIDTQRITSPWLIDTKYYTAEVDLIGVSQQSASNEILNENAEALIVYIETEQSTNWDQLLTWSPSLDESSAEVKLLLVNHCSDHTEITKFQAMDWCLTHSFEFIDLSASPVDADEDQIIEEKVGIERAIEALQAHTWSNLVMKNANDQESGLQHDIDDDFTELFTELSIMRDSLLTLPVGQRRHCAEQVVKAFWNAIGGEDEEIVE